MCDNSLLTDVNACGSDAPIAVVRPHDVNPGANRDGARGDRLTSLGVAGTRYLPRKQWLNTCAA
jgi:hypothetical protein